jgi:hypothetical protein
MTAQLVRDAATREHETWITRLRTGHRYLNEMQTNGSERQGTVAR